MSNSNKIGGNQDAEMLRMRIESAKDEGSSKSNMARDMMEAFSPEKILGALGEVFKILGSISG